MHIYINPEQAGHSPRHEVFRGEIVPCFENTSRFDFVLDEIKRRNWRYSDVFEDFGLAPITRVHSPRYVAFLQGAWDEWVALDAANANEALLLVRNGHAFDLLFTDVIMPGMNGR